MKCFFQRDAVNSKTCSLLLWYWGYGVSSLSIEAFGISGFSSVFEPSMTGFVVSCFILVDLRDAVFCRYVLTLLRLKGFLLLLTCSASNPSSVAPHKLSGFGFYQRRLSAGSQSSVSASSAPRYQWYPYLAPDTSFGPQAERCLNERP